MPLALLVPDLVKIGDTGQNDKNFAPDGKHIGALMPVEAPETQKAQSHTIFENFFDELRRRVPAGR